MSPGHSADQGLLGLPGQNLLRRQDFYAPVGFSVLCPIVVKKPSRRDMDRMIQGALFMRDRNVFIPHQDRPYVVDISRALGLKMIPLKKDREPSACLDDGGPSSAAAPPLPVPAAAWKGMGEKSGNFLIITAMRSILFPGRSVLPGGSGLQCPKRKICLPVKPCSRSNFSRFLVISSYSCLSIFHPFRHSGGVSRRDSGRPGDGSCREVGGGSGSV